MSEVKEYKDGLTKEQVRIILNWPLYKSKVTKDGFNLIIPFKDKSNSEYIQKEFFRVRRVQRTKKGKRQ